MVFLKPTGTLTDKLARPYSEGAQEIETLNSQLKVFSSWFLVHA
jgi:hypothetical protein